MNKTSKYIFSGILALLILSAGCGLGIIFTGFDIDKTTYIYIDNNKNYDSLLVQIRDKAKVRSLTSFRITASLLSCSENLKPGRYAVSNDMSVLDLARALRNGRQSPVKLKFNNIRTKEDFSKRISEQLIINNDSLYAALENEETCEKYGFTPSTILAMFIPNTYEFYWNVSIDNFLERMNKEYLKFWNNERISKAKEIGLTPVQAAILASIVEEECTYSDEYSMVAGLYLNRLRINQPLQADPTVKFAVGDFSLRRILNIHLQTESPYNTYRHTGLPPGPIRIPSIKGIDSVLDASQHGYYYMCAKSDFSGRHDFSKTFAEHQKYAAQYRAELNKRNILQ